MTSDRHWTTTPTLVGRWVRLEPLAPAHAADLLEILRADPAVLEFFPPPVAPVEPTLAGLERYIASRTSDSLALAMIDLGDGPTRGRAIGSSCYMDRRPAHRGVEIGATFIHPAHRGTRVNPESKLLMLTHAMEAMGAVRVQLKCDGRNVRSQRAIEKLGAVREGVLRKHMVMADGFVRDTVMYSITQAEWPGVRKGLEGRVGV